MKNGSDSGQEPGFPGTRSPGSAPPSLDELAQQFPQLEILELLGQGGMGIVYKARQPRLDRFVALKILPAEAGRDPAFAERFAREARALAKLTHPGIIAVYDFGESDGRFYLLMEFVDGVNLRRLLRERRLKPEEALQIVPQICQALQYAHDQGVIHRDIKPENILLDKQGHVKIADFGLAKLLGSKAADSALTGSQQVMGTPHYMAPEQMERPLAVDHRADIYSLGVVFYEMLTGELPLGRFAPPSQKVQVDVRLDEVVLRALEREPERRYQHASDVKAEVESITPGTPATAPNAGPPGVSDQVLFRRVTILTLVGLALWNVALAALNWGYIARADWYFRKELPYEWLQTLWWWATLVCLGFGSWWYYLLVKRPGTPRSLQDFGRVWRTFDDPRLRPAWKPLALWFGVWFTATVYVLWRFGFEENIPFLLVMQGGLGLTPFALMAMFWFVVRQPDHASDAPAIIRQGHAVAGPPPNPENRTRSAAPAVAHEHLERPVSPFSPENKIAAIEAYGESTRASRAEPKEAVEAIPPKHGLPLSLSSLLNSPATCGILLCVLGIAALFIPAVTRHLDPHTLEYERLAPGHPAGNQRWVAVPDTGLLSWEWTSILATFLALGLFLIGAHSVRRLALLRAFAMLLAGTGIFVLDVVRVRPVYESSEHYTTPYVGSYVVGALAVGLLILGAMALRFALLNGNHHADAQAMKFLGQKLQSLWESALFLCVGSRVKGTSNNLTGDNLNDAPLSGAALEGGEPVRHEANPPAITPERNPVGSSPILPGELTSNPPSALPHEQSPVSGRSTMKVAIAIFLIILGFGLILLFVEWGNEAVTVPPKRDAALVMADVAPGVRKKDIQRIQGTWVAVSAERNGREAPEREVRRIAMTFQGDRVKVKGFKENADEEGTFRLDPTHKLRWFDLAVANKRMPGIYLLEADSLTICFNQNDAGQRPKRFAAGKGTEVRLIVLKRQKP
jgi:uncharacterized protein (TIGR03067 family)